MSPLVSWTVDNIEYSYDPLVDSFYVKYQDGTFSHNQDFSDWITADIGTSGEVLGMEFIGISNHIDLPNNPSEMELSHIPVHLLPSMAREHSVPR